MVTTKSQRELVIEILRDRNKRNALEHYISHEITEQYVMMNNQNRSGCVAQLRNKMGDVSNDISGNEERRLVTVIGMLTPSAEKAEFRAFKSNLTADGIEALVAALEDLPLTKVDIPKNPGFLSFLQRICDLLNKIFGSKLAIAPQEKGAKGFVNNFEREFRAAYPDSEHSVGSSRTQLLAKEQSASVTSLLWTRGLGNYASSHARPVAVVNPPSSSGGDTLVTKPRRVRALVKTTHTAVPSDGSVAAVSTIIHRATVSADKASSVFKYNLNDHYDQLEDLFKAVKAIAHKNQKLIVNTKNGSHSASVNMLLRIDQGDAQLWIDDDAGVLKSVERVPIGDILSLVIVAGNDRLFYAYKDGKVSRVLEVQKPRATAQTSSPDTFLSSSFETGARAGRAPHGGVARGDN